LPYRKLAVRRTAILLLGKSEGGRKALKLALKKQSMRTWIGFS
jgi:hypothetical protein